MSKYTNVNINIDEKLLDYLCEKRNKELAEENEHLKKERDYWASKYEERTETFESNLAEENKRLQQELQGMNELLKSYRKTIKHDAELLADATKNGYLPPLDDLKGDK